jgi:DNA-binding response OmpR family regulator
MEMMSTRKMRINVALNGNDGYHKATSLQPSLILLDITMPIMDGFATCRWLKSNKCTRHIPVIFLSASNEVERRIDGLSLGAVDFIGKPFNENEVMARIEIHLNLARQNQLPLVASKLDEIEQQDNAPCRDRELLNMATQYLSQHISTPPSQEALARILGTNEKRLKQAFHIGFSMPIFTWLREERLRQARNLLATTETPVADIAAYLGYSSPANFAKAFRERFDCSPRDLRNEMQKVKQQNITEHGSIK